MTPLIIGIICFLILIVLLALGVNVGTTMALVAFGGMASILTLDASMVKMATVPFSVMNDYNFAVMPMFVLMANIIASTGVGKSLYDLFYVTIGRFRGGLAMSTILACAVFAAISSTTVATAVTIGLIALPEMKKMKYSDALSTGSIAAGGTLGVLIPPSSVMINYAIMAQIGVTELFVAGIIPGIILAVFMCIAIQFTCIKDKNAGPAGPKFSAKEAWTAFMRCGEIIILIIVVLVGMFIGFFTPTEASAVGAAGAIIITLVRRRLTWTNFLEAIKGTLKNTGMIYFILIGAFIMNSFVAMTTIPTALSNLIVGLNMDYRIVTIFVIAIYLILGCFLDSLAMVLLTVPIFLPVMLSLGADPIWFGIIVVLAMQMGCITPPVGMNVYVTAGLDKSIPMATVFKGIVPFLIAMIASIVILILFPNLATFLPSLLQR